MITILKGDMFDQGHGALVNPVNCIGVMGKGLAKKFKKRYPPMFIKYKRECIQNRIRPGRMSVFTDSDDGSIVINFPTEDDYREPPEQRKRKTYRHIKRGLPELINTIEYYSIKSIGIPALGCGVVGAEWKKVLPMIAEAFINDDRMDNVRVFIYWPL
jgi:O-acetyl-ADP-ribose deacetylase (regulator of RNase III)